jgi:RNA polymerase sigma-70 factor, ECF subfamily
MMHGFANLIGLTVFGKVSGVATGTPLEPEPSLKPEPPAEPEPPVELKRPAEPKPPVERQSDPMDATEEEIAAGFSAGEERCLELAFRRWAPLIYTVAQRTLDSPGDAEEVTQQVFVSAWRARTNYRPADGSLPGWLIGICRHRIADRQRARGRDLRLVQAVTRETDLRVQPESITTLIDRVVLADEIQRLPPPRGTILQLAFWEGRSYPQIAEQLELPLGTVKSHARRALLHLRTRLQEVTS